MEIIQFTWTHQKVKQKITRERKDLGKDKLEKQCAKEEGTIYGKFRDQFTIEAFLHQQRKMSSNEESKPQKNKLKRKQREAVTSEDRKQQRKLGAASSHKTFLFLRLLLASCLPTD